MSIKLDSLIAETGTKFQVFVLPRHLKSFSLPELIQVSVAPQGIRPGPRDDRMYVCNAVSKRPYTKDYLPPFQGPVHPPVGPGEDGHFNHLSVDSPEFVCAAAYASARRTLDIWEDYMGRNIAWPFRLEFEMLEIIPLARMPGARIGWGFLEFGFAGRSSDELDLSHPYALNMEATARGIGRDIFLSEVGIPLRSQLTPELVGVVKTTEDISALLAVLHSHKILNHLLDATSGDLFSPDVIGRIGELSEVPFFRLALNQETMSSVPTKPRFHMPLTGALVELLIQVFKYELISLQIIDPELFGRLEKLSYPDKTDYMVQTEFDIAYLRYKPEFKICFQKARDYLGMLIARAWPGLSCESLTFFDVGLALLSADQFVSGGKHIATLRRCFSRREIGLPKATIALEPANLVPSPNV
ncbi:MAG: hypothetical protein HYZ11_06040 [Candidatus Tectomicrobia bacterium]|uniref:Uncharacterized protein n=1 Tax=Tectimicrobiota bacterium TaxID=2528274 RepID=A0A932I0R0_UNCTE|nr:hypothetical protein [Candidatus Tectomicrobia bacterium]